MDCEAHSTLLVVAFSILQVPNIFAPTLVTAQHQFYSNQNQNQNYENIYQGYQQIGQNQNHTATHPYYQKQNYMATNQNQNLYVPNEISEPVTPKHNENYVNSLWRGYSVTEDVIVRPAHSALQSRDYGNKIIGKHYVQPSNQLLAQDDEDKCGGILEVSGIRTLSYKYRKPYDRYESCIWTLNAINKPMIRVNITESYFRSTEDYIAIGYFSNFNYDRIDSFKWHRTPRDSFTNLSVEVPGPVAFIHFVSTANNPGLGFRLTYEAFGDPINSFYTLDNYFLTGEYGIFKYPPVGVEYGNNQRTTIVIKASSNNGTEPSVLNLKKVNIEESLGCTKDSLSVFAFGGGGWYKNGTFCGQFLANANAYFFHPRNDPMILTFRSNESGVRNGFEFLWRSFN